MISSKGIVVMNFDSWNPTAQNLHDSIQLVRDYFGKKWLKEQSDKFKQKPIVDLKKFTHHLRPSPHPIIPIYVASLRKYRELQENPNINFNQKSLKMISFCQNLSKTRKMRTIDLDGNLITRDSQDRFIERLKNRDEFNQTAYEIQIAVALTRKGFSTSFIQESDTPSEKTPDILVRYKKQNVYVECKHQGATKRETQYRNMFKEFYWRIMRIMFRTGEFYAICVEWNKDPILNDIISNVNIIEEKIKNKREANMQTDSSQIWLEHLASGDKTLTNPLYDARKHSSDAEHSDIIIQQMHFGNFGGSSTYKYPTVVMFRNISYLDDLVKGAVGAINKAYSQIPENGPSIIFLENRISYFDKNLQKVASNLQRRIQGKLNLISRVNKVILTRSYFDRKRFKIGKKPAIGIFRKVESRIINNPTPARSLCLEFDEKIKNLKFY